MSLNLYTGSLKRFYARDYERPAARDARLQGVNYRLVTPTGSSGKLSKIDALIQIRQIKLLLAEKAPFVSDWDDEIADYHSEQLTFEGHSALYYASALAELSKPIKPIKLSDVDNFSLDSLGLSSQQIADNPAVMFEADMIYPGGEANMSMLVAETGERLVLANLDWLYGCLLRIEDRLWSGSTDVEKWLRDGPLGTYETDNIEELVLHNAKFAYAVYRTVLDFALKHNVPIVIDE